MKLAASGVAMVCLLAVFLVNLRAQGNQALEPKHIMTAPLNGGRAVSLTALSIERGPYPSVIQLRGNVEIRTPVCLAAGAKTVCDEMILRADRAEFHEDSGEIEAHGEVTVTPVRHKD